MKKNYFLQRIISLVWAIGWIIFALFSVKSSLMTIIIEEWIRAVPGFIFLITALIAWKWGRIGGILLLVQGMILLLGYPFLMYGFQSVNIIIIAIITLAIPPLISGYLFLKRN